MTLVTYTCLILFGIFVAYMAMAITVGAILRLTLFVRRCVTKSRTSRMPPQSAVSR